MSRHRREPDRPGVTDLVGRLAEGIGRLLGQHLALARIELGEEARTVGRALGTMALFIPLLIVGYAMLNFGVAFALARWLNVPGAVLLIGAINLVLGGVGLWRAKRLLKRPVLDQTSEVVRESARALAAELRPEVPDVH